MHCECIVISFPSSLDQSEKAMEVLKLKVTIFKGVITIFVRVFSGEYRGVPAIGSSSLKSPQKRTTMVDCSMLVHKSTQLSSSIQVSFLSNIHG